MTGRNRLFSNLLTFLLVVVVVLVGIKTKDSDKQIKKWRAEIERRAERGVEDPILKETVDKLESNLKARLSETFELETDPLDLTRVIRTKKFLKKIGAETAETEGRMRLAGIISSGNSSSVIVKYKGRSRMVGVGDRIGDYRVAYIGKTYANLVRGDEVLRLTPQKAPDTLAELEALYGAEGERLPKVKVKTRPADAF